MKDFTNKVTLSANSTYTTQKDGALAIMIWSASGDITIDGCPVVHAYNASAGNYSLSKIVEGVSKGCVISIPPNSDFEGYFIPYL